jgi:hypothetical protein
VKTAEELEAEKKAKTEAARLRKELDGKLMKCKALKIRYDAAHSAYSEMDRACTSQPEWNWCTEHHLAEPLGLQKRFDAFKAGSPFWSAWAVQSGGFANYAKKHFERNVLDSSLSRTTEIEKLVGGLEKSVGKLMKMHCASLEK